MADNEYQNIPTNYNLEWAFRNTCFIAKILDYDGYSENVTMFTGDPYGQYGIVEIPAFYLIGLREHHYADKSIKVKITIERIDDEILE